MYVGVAKKPSSGVRRQATPMEKNPGKAVLEMDCLLVNYTKRAITSVCSDMCEKYGTHTYTSMF